MEAPVKKLALLCPGPSLCAYPGSDDYDTVVGVNRVAARHRLDWWVCLDAHTPGKLTGQVLGQPYLVCSRQTREEILLSWPLLTHLPHVVHTDIQGLPAQPAGWQGFGASTALAVCELLSRAGRLRKPALKYRIDVFGVDWAGTADWDGHTDPRNRRGGDRWTRDRQVWTATTKLIEGRGIAVNRHPAGGAAK